jgi:hypothetical protein
LPLRDHRPADHARILERFLLAELEINDASTRGLAHEEDLELKCARQVPGVVAVR